MKKCSGAFTAIWTNEVGSFDLLGIDFRHFYFLRFDEILVAGEHAEDYKGIHSLSSLRIGLRKI